MGDAAPDAAVQIVRDAMRPRFGYITSDEVRPAVAALDQGGWLHDPAEVERLQFIEARARNYLYPGVPISARGTATVILGYDTLDAAPADDPTPKEHVIDEQTPEEGSLSAALLAQVANGQARDLKAARTRVAKLEAENAALRAVVRQMRDTCRDAIAADPMGGGRGLTARVVLLMLEDSGITLDAASAGTTAEGEPCIYGQCNGRNCLDCLEAADRRRTAVAKLVATTAEGDPPPPGAGLPLFCP